MANNLLNAISNNLPPGIDKLCSNVQTILTATSVAAITSAILSMTNNKDNEFATFILTITLIITSIALLLYSYFIYLSSKNNVNLCFVGIYLIYFFYSLFIYYNYKNKLDVFNVLPQYIKTSSNLLRFILATLLLSIFIFSIFNLNYALYTPTTS